MSEKIISEAKINEAKDKDSISRKRKIDFPQPISSSIEQILFFQRTIGNQVVERLFKSGAIQAMLKISQPNDKYEQEADRVAEQVMRVSEPQPRGRINVSQKVQIPSVNSERSTSDQTASSTVPSIVHEVLQSPGKPLDLDTRAFMEPRFEYDFSSVRVHTDAKAADSAQMINALAYTVGQHVVFASGQLKEQTLPGRRIIAHELTHVVQQDTVAKTSKSLSISQKSPRSEHEAQTANASIEADNMLNPIHERISPTLQKSEVPKEQATPEETRAWWEIRDLKVEAKKKGIKRHFEVIQLRDPDGRVKYKVRGDPLQREVMTGVDLLKVLRELKILYFPSPEYAPPTWLDDVNAQKFWYRVVRSQLRETGVTVKSFGAEITIKGTEFVEREGERVLAPVQYKTGNQVIWVRNSGTEVVLQAFRYKPTEREAYEDEIMYRVGRDFNHHMYRFVEQQKKSPERAYEELKAINKEVERLTLLLILYSLAGPL